jgi:hypothetical protein
MSDTLPLDVEPEEVTVEPEPLVPEIEVEPEPDAPVEVEKPAGLTPVQERQVAEALRDLDAVVPLAEVLPADFPLPVLTKFVPNVLLKQRADQAAVYALSVDVTGAEGIERADLALETLSASLKGITEHFAEPCAIANELHKRLTGVRGQWLEPGEQAKRTVGGRIFTERRRLQAIADEARRKAQEEADRQAREQAKREAEAARKNQAPPQVVQELQKRAETASAPPVPDPVPLPAMRGNTVVATRKARPKGTRSDADPNPDIGEMTPQQIASVKELLKAILEDKAPIAYIAVNYSALNLYAKAAGDTFNVPGFESVEIGGVRAKGGRRR